MAWHGVPFHSACWTRREAVLNPSPETVADFVVDELGDAGHGSGDQRSGVERRGNSAVGGLRGQNDAVPRTRYWRELTVPRIGFGGSSLSP